MCKLLTHKNGDRPSGYDIFVFGSNLAGRHGAGAARAAIEYGAEIGKGVGLCSNSYAIPTKDYSIKTLPLIEIKGYVDEFCKFVKSSPSLKFFITEIGCGLAGYSSSQIAPMFAALQHEENCSFTSDFREKMKIPQHRVVCSAIRAEDGEILIGIRHYSVDMHNQISARKDGNKFCNRSGDDQGFVDQFGDYLTREEAFEIATLANQIARPNFCKNNLLYSECLY